MRVSYRKRRRVASFSSSSLSSSSRSSSSSSLSPAPSASSFRSASSLSSTLSSCPLSQSPPYSFLDQLSKELEDEMLQTSTSTSGENISLTSTSTSSPRLFLIQLPTDVLLRVLSFLRSRDVCAVAVLCRCLCSLCKSRELWSTLYVRRWPVYKIAQELSGSGWREKYRKKHETEMRQLSKGCSPELLPHFIQMELAKMHSKKRDLNEFNVIEQWLDNHPTARLVTRSQRENHSCSKQTCKYFNVHELYICEQTGKVHFCGIACKKQREDGDLLTCEVSGRSCYSDSDTETEEPGLKVGIAVGMEGSDSLEGDDDDDDGQSFLAKCYSYGYSCTSEMEYQQVLDVVLPP